MKTKSTFLFSSLCLLFFGLLLVCIILIKKNMADPVWGQLAKAQDDAETIEEAIARLIASHESDAGAHTGAGESLETHKSQEIVDHPAGSILADKETFTEVVTKPGFESDSQWTITGWAGCEGSGQAGLSVEYGVQNESSMKQGITWPTGFTAWNKNWLLQFIAWSNFGTGLTFRVYLAGDTKVDGFGIEFLDGNVRGFVKDGSTFTYTSYFTINHTIIHSYRAIYEKTDEEFRFYVDGILKGTIAKTDEVPAEDMNIHIDATANQDIGEEISVNIKSVMISIEI